MRSKLINIHSIAPNPKKMVKWKKQKKKKKKKLDTYKELT